VSGWGVLGVFVFGCLGVFVFWVFGVFSGAFSLTTALGRRRNPDENQLSIMQHVSGIILAA
jgi:hypothetical protein